MREKWSGPAPVEGVEPGSPAEEAGIRAGDSILEMDGERLRDLIDWYLLLADEVPHRCVLERDGRGREVTLDCGGRPAGIRFETPVFDTLLLCRNRCIFCFVDQMPPGLRDAFYVKDDDYRLSFLGGNFVTLTNMTRADVQRVIEERLSPLYVSLHAVERDVRRELFGRKGTEKALQILEKLTGAGIEAHVQIVLLRGLNDESQLDRTLAYLQGAQRGIASVGVVPVGVTRGGRKPIDPRYGFDRGSAARVLEQLEGWRERLGEAGPYAADEFFFMAGEEVPALDYYRGGFPQLENGVGLAASFLEGVQVPGSEKRAREGVVVATTPIGAWALAPLGLEERGVRLLRVENSLFGPSVDVCGLMTGRDVAEALAREDGVRLALVPGVALSDEEEFVDGVTLSEAAARAGAEVRALDDAASLLEQTVDGEGDRGEG